MTPLTPLDTFFKAMMLHPWHSWQIADSAASVLSPVIPVSATCNDLIYEYAWQSSDGVAGRADIRDAIETAESKVKTLLGYSIAPHFVTETILAPRYMDQRNSRLGYAAPDGRWLPVQLSEGKVITIGIEARTLIGTVTTAGGSLVFSDADGDGLNDTFTITIATTVTDVDQIAVYFAAADRLDGEAVSEDYRIAPVKVSISGGIATIKGRLWLLVKPIKYQSPSQAALEPSTLTNFAASLEVYKYFCNPTGTTTDTAQAKLIWETRPFPVYATTPSDNSLDPAAQAYAIARCALRDPENGIIGIGEAVYDTTNAVWESVNLSTARPPDRIEVRYQAGAPLVDHQVDPLWASIMAHFAGAELGKRVCSRITAGRELQYWQIDRAFSGNATEERFVISPEDLNGPFGTRNGHIAAWREVQRRRKFTGVIA